MSGARRLAAAAAFVLLLAALFTLSGCGSRAGQYARDARSSYISARAVLVGLQEFPSQVEGLLRGGDPASAADDVLELARDARALGRSAASAFKACREKCEAVMGEDDGEHAAYAEKLQRLVDLNGEAIDLYSGFLTLTESVVEGLPYRGDPSALARKLAYMDTAVMRIEELARQITQLEEEAESLFLQLSRPASPRMGSDPENRGQTPKIQTLANHPGFAGDSVA